MLQRALTVILVLGFAISGSKLVGFGPQLQPMLGPIYDWSMPIMVLAFLLRNILGGMNASGAFEIIDANSGRVIFSKLRSGRMPNSLGEVMTLVDEQYPKGDQGKQSRREEREVATRAEK